MLRHRAAVLYKGWRESSSCSALRKESKERLERKEENKIDKVSVPKGQSGNSSWSWRRREQRLLEGVGQEDGKKGHHSRSAPEPEKPKEDTASKVSSTSK